MRINLPFRHRVAVIAVVVDILMTALIHVIPFYFLSIEDVFININDYPLYFSLINIWALFHVPVVLLPINSPVFSYENYNVELMRSMAHFILCFLQTYIVFYVLGLLLERKRKR
jgi:hypothetical protein